MRTTLTLLFLAFTFGISGCKYPDTVQLHGYAEDDLGGPIAWHSYVKKDYEEFANWASGGSTTPAETTAAPIAHDQ